ncbi:hypothetical protein ACFY0P_43640 [Streptomyces sp. NPDC001714]|uniref:hypothetical protein n=1 Tax=Streptomyces sp. NPDC001714 TaxID=3364603 RepID=UPI0036874314
MDPVSASLLVAMANGAAGEAGKQLWEGLSRVIRRTPAGESRATDTLAGELELAALEESPNELDRAQALSEALQRRAENDGEFRASLQQWHQQAQNLRTGDGETRNIISGGTQKGPILQGRDFSGINFNTPGQ